jgi:hypothetical protein
MQHCQVANRGGAKRQNTQSYVIEAIKRPAAMPAPTTATHNIAVLALLTCLNIPRCGGRLRALPPPTAASISSRRSSGTVIAEVDAQIGVRRLRNQFVVARRTGQLGRREDRVDARIVVA